MKRLFIAIAIVSGLTANAQVSGPSIKPNTVGYMLSAPTHATTDTITNTTPKTQYAIVKGSNQVATAHATLTKISGTVAGTVKLQGSVLGVNYVDIGSAFTLTDTATQSCSFVVAPSSYQYYRILVTPSGTQSTKIQTAILVRQ